MKVLLLHLSDIHIKDDNKTNSILTRVEALSAAVTSYIPTVDSCMILVTGDIAYSGLFSEYQIAINLLQNIKLQITKHYKTDITFVIVPGNHDCDFSLHDSIRAKLLETVNPIELDSTMIDKFTSVQTNFFDFCEQLTQPDLFISQVVHIQNKLFTLVTYSLLNCHISFQLINSAWMSTRHEVQGKLLYPVEKFNDIPNYSPAPDAVITMFHHPYNWLEANNARHFRQVVENTSDIILTGHEHEDAQFSKEYGNGDRIEYFEGGVLQDNGQPDTSSFNALVLDIDGKQQRWFRFSWTSDSLYKATDYGIQPFQRNKHRLQREFEISASFSKTLDDPGARYTHTLKEEVFLHDIFIYPDLKELSVDVQKANRKIKQPHILKGDKLIPLILDNKRVLITGEDRVGKTMLARNIFSDLSKQGIIPVLMHGENFTTMNEDRISSAIEREFSCQYMQGLYERYRQFDKSKKCIIVDDYHGCRLNHSGRQELLTILVRMFDIVILLGANEICMEELLSSNSDAFVLWSFKHYEIVPFGNVLRSELIKKWYFLGHTYTEDENTIHAKIIQAQNRISELLGRNFIPPYPSFVLMMLQQLEIKDNLKTISGSCGQLYEVLITTSLSRSSTMGIDIDTKYTYLTELAYYMFHNKIKSADEDKLRLWHESYCDVYKLNIEYNSIRNDLVMAGVFNRGNEVIRFNYKYLYYYFVARYFRDHINEQEIRQLIQEMSSRLHHEETANIMIFLSYLSKDPFIITTMMESSKELFRAYRPCDLSSDIGFTNDLMLKEAQLMIKSTNTQENRQRMLEQKDKLEDEEDYLRRDLDGDDSDEISREDQIPQEIVSINAAYKTIQILGQVLRNFPGSLKGDVKYTLAEECYLLGLRMITVYMDLFKENHENMIHLLSEYLLEKEPGRDERKTTEEAKEFIRMLIEGIVFSMVKHISNSVGLKELSRTFEEVVSKNNGISFRIIDLSIKMDHYQNFPHGSVLETYASQRKNRFTANLIRLMVWYHFYLHPVKHSILQQTCQRLGITVSPVLLPRKAKSKLKKNH